MNPSAKFERPAGAPQLMHIMLISLRYTPSAEAIVASLMVKYYTMRGPSVHLGNVGKPSLWRHICVG